MENLQGVPRSDVPDDNDHRDLELMALVEGAPPPTLHRNDSFLMDELVRGPSMGACCSMRSRPGNWVNKLPKYISRSMCHVLFGTKMNWLLLCVPLAMVGVQGVLGHGWVFALSLLGMVPLAERLGFVTEQLSFFTGSTGYALLIGFSIWSYQCHINSD